MMMSAACNCLASFSKARFTLSLKPLRATNVIIHRAIVRDSVRGILWQRRKALDPQTAQGIDFGLGPGMRADGPVQPGEVPGRGDKQE